MKMMKNIIGYVFMVLLIDDIEGYEFNYDFSYGPNPQYRDDPGNYFTLDWSLVPTTSVTTFPNLPAGCQCMNEQETSSTCTSFLCTETCDINLGTCDYGCCTDPDCSTAQVEAFTLAGLCTTYDPYGYTMCTDTSTLAKVNAKYNMFVEQDTETLSGLLCVSVENNPYEGEFYTPQSSLVNNPSELAKSIYAQTYSFAVNQYQTASTTNVYYTNGAPVPAALKIGEATDQTPLLSNIGYMRLPTAGPDGTCQNTNLVGFGTDVQRNLCIQSLVLSTACSTTFGILSTSLFAEALYIAKNPSAAEIASYAAATTTTVLYVNQETGAETDITSTSVPSTSWDLAGLVCSYAVVGASYNILFTTSDTISAVNIVLRVSNITAPSLTSTVAFSQEFGITFTAAVLNTNVTVPRIVSGNPGYIVGLPVQSGNKQTQGSLSAIQYNQNGMTMMAASGPAGACYTTSDAWYSVASTTSVSTTPVFFGVNTASSCTVTMNVTQFYSDISTWCVDISKYPLFTLANNYLGVYGNADPLQIWDWVEVSYVYGDIVTTKPITDSPITRNYCQHMVTSMNIEILWMKSAQVNDPQPMILSARVVFGQDNWVWSSPATIQQTFTLSSTVTYIEVPQGSANTNNYKPPIPPLLPGIPYDVFYPFDINSLGVRPGQSGIVTVMLLSIIAFVC